MQPSPRWSADAQRWLRRALWPGAVAVGLAAEAASFDWSAAGSWIPDLLTGWTLCGCGLVAWARRPGSRSGVLLTTAGFAWFMPNFWSAALYFHRGPLVQAALTYPLGRTRRRWDLGVVAVGYVAALARPVWRDEIVAIALSALLLVAGLAASLRGTPQERRMRRAALQATAWLSLTFVVPAVARLADNSAGSVTTTLHVYEAMLAAFAAALVVGLLRWPWSRVEVTDLVVELGEARSASVRELLARALGDPSLQVGFWVPEAAGYLTTEGNVLALPDASDPLRSATHVERGGEPVAVLVHDPALLDDPGLIDAVAAAAKLGAANSRLQADLQGRVAALTASRRRILAAAGEERMRLERRLRQGAQRTLDDLGDVLTEAHAAATDAGVAREIEDAKQQLGRTQEDLRRLARGIHPRALSEAGLAEALAATAAEAPFAVELSLPALAAGPRATECAYFVCSEALANAAKHADARLVRISAAQANGSITLTIVDDGRGGADAREGGGLRGLADRVEALGGTFEIESAPGGGTRVLARIPAAA